MKTITGIYARNIETVKRVIVECKQRLMRAQPIQGFPHYWALIPIEPASLMRHKKDNH
ncbi:MAG: hypothetical protein ABIN36_19595 [Ferruginibacter sp.]